MVTQYKKKMAPNATTDRLGRTTERNYVNMQLTSLYTLIYRHAKTTLLQQGPIDKRHTNNRLTHTHPNTQ